MKTLNNINQNQVNSFSHFKDCVNENTIYGVLNAITFNNWDYKILKEEVLKIDSFDFNFVSITLSLKFINLDKSFTGIGVCKIESLDYREEAVKKALCNALNVINETYSGLGSSIDLLYDDVSEETQIEKIEDAPTLDEIIQLEQLEEKQEGDKPISKANSTIGIRDDQIMFINEFKLVNEINDDEKFNYFVKTWSTHNGLEISNKLELVSAGPTYLDMFIDWIKTVQADKISNKSIEHIN